MNTTTLEVALAPSEFPAIKARDLTNTTCVVFDILRATTSMTVAFANGAKSIIPVGEISDAVALHNANTAVLLAGERHGLRILKAQTGTVDFDFGNSPREFLTNKISGKTLVTTTTNGTRALQACASAHTTLIGSFLNLNAVARWLLRKSPQNLLLVCAGTFEEAAYEDILAAGALANALWDVYGTGKVTDSTHLARQAFQLTNGNLIDAMKFARNGRHLLTVPDLCEDVPFSFQRDIYSFVAGMTRPGELQILS